MFTAHGARGHWRTVTERISSRGVCGWSFVAASVLQFLGVFASLAVFIQPVCLAQDFSVRSPEHWPVESTDDSDCVYQYPVVEPACGDIVMVLPIIIQPPTGAGAPCPGSIPVTTMCSPTPTFTPSLTPTYSASPTSSPTGTPTPLPTSTPTLTSTPTPTPSPTGTPTPLPTSTPTPTPTPTSTPIPPAACRPGDTKCACGDHPRLWFNMAAYRAGAMEFLCGKCAPGMSWGAGLSPQNMNGGSCWFSGTGSYPKTKRGDIVCSIRADGHGSMFVTSSENPNGCSQSEFKDRGMGGVPTGNLACIKWVNGKKRDVSNVNSGACRASSYPDNYRTEAGWTICVRYRDGTMIVSKDPNGCNNT